MKSDTITPFLKKFQKAQHRLQQKVAAIAEARTDESTFATTLETLGRPSYKDDKAIQEVAITRLKLESCTATIPKLEGDEEQAADELRPLVSEASNMVVRLLSPVCELRWQTISSVIRPFCESDDHARDLARQTSALRKADGRLRYFADIPMRSRNCTISQIMESCAALEAVLVEATKPHPLLHNFIVIETPSEITAGANVAASATAEPPLSNDLAPTGATAADAAT